MRHPSIRPSVIWQFCRCLVIAAIIFCWGPMAIADSAADTFRDAYEHRYTWDQDFPGYSAAVTVNYDGQTAQGIVQVYPDLSVEVLNIGEPGTKQFVSDQLRMEMIHRRRVPFNFVHGDNQFELEESHEPGRLTIREVGGTRDSWYQVQDRVIQQVNRTFGDVAVTVDTLHTTDTPDGYLVSEFKTVYRDRKTQEMIEQENVKDIHRKVKNYYVLTSRIIQPLPIESNSVTTRISSLQFSRFQPLLKANAPLLGI